jgi:hypothetical protein
MYTLRNLEPHPLFHPEDHEDELRDRFITMVLHPMLQGYTEDEKEALMAPAVVWFDSKEEVS